MDILDVTSFNTYPVDPRDHGSENAPVCECPRCKRGIESLSIVVGSDKMYYSISCDICQMHSAPVYRKPWQWSKLKLEKAIDIWNTECRIVEKALKQADPNAKLYSAGEIANLVGVSRACVYYWIDKGYLNPSFTGKIKNGKVKKRWYKITLDDLVTMGLRHPKSRVCFVNEKEAN